MLVGAMLPALTSLLALQKVESRADEARRRIADAPARVQALDTQLAEATAALDRAKTALAESQTARRELEKEAASAQQKVSKYKEQLMQAKDNKQFHALQHEIATFSAEVQRVEGLVLERMLEGDELTAAVKSAETRLAADKKHVATQKSQIDAEATELSATLAALQTERAELVTAIDPRLLATFETVLKGRKGVASPASSTACARPAGCGCGRTSTTRSAAATRSSSARAACASSTTCRRRPSPRARLTPRPRARRRRQRPSRPGARRGWTRCSASSSVPEPKFADIFRAGHPASLRCSSVEYSRYSPSSRLAIRAPRPEYLSPNFGSGTLAARRQPLFRAPDDCRQASRRGALGSVRLEPRQVGLRAQTGDVDVRG